MTMMDSELSPGEAGELFDLRQARNVAGLVLRSLKRHWVRALTSFVSIFGAAILLGSSTPKIFQSYSALQLKPTNTSDLIAPNENRNTPDPRAGVSETVLQQKNLRLIVKELNLVADLDATQGPIAKLFGKLSSAPPDLANKELDAIAELRSRITVDVPTDPGIYETTIAATWGDPVKARDITKRLQDNFIADRRRTEVSQIESIVKLLEEQSAQSDAVVEKVRSRIGPVSPLEANLSDQAELTAVFSQQSEARSKLTNGQVTLAAAKTDFDFRYGIASEPEIPKRALTSRLRTYLLGMIAGLMAALFVAAMADLLKGSFIESWQITRKLNVPVLAEVGE